MKVVVDFDDVLFDAAKLKEKFFSVLEACGVTDARNEYTYERKDARPFSLRRFLGRVLKEKGIHVPTEEVYEEVMSVCKELRNEELVKTLMDAGKESCYIVTSGEEEFQHDKISRSGLGEHAHIIIVVPGSKKEVVESICKEFPNETIVFIDDKNTFFADLDYKNHPNLKTLLYEGHESLAMVEKEIQEGLRKEFESFQQNSGPKMR